MTVTIETSVEINAHIDQVWQVLSRLENYKAWNSGTWFNKKAEPGKKQVMHVKLLGRWLAVPVEILHHHVEQGVRWRGGIPFVFTGSHYFKLENKNNQTTVLIQGEDFNGIFVPLLLPVLKKSLQSLYLGMNNDIKKYCEAN